MYLLAIMRLLFGLLPSTRCVPRSALGQTTSKEVRHSKVERSSALPHEWMNLDFVLTESSGLFRNYGRGTFDEAHPLRPFFQFLRHLAWGTELCPVPVAKQRPDLRPRHSA